MTDTTRESVERWINDCLILRKTVQIERPEKVRQHLRWQDQVNAEAEQIVLALLTRAEAALEHMGALVERLEAAEAERDALAAKLAVAVDGLKASEKEIDGYILAEYPGDNPVQERYRQRDYDANPARIALATLTASSPPLNTQTVIIKTQPLQKEKKSVHEMLQHPSTRVKKVVILNMGVGGLLKYLTIVFLLYRFIIIIDSYYSEIL